MTANVIVTVERQFDYPRQQVFRAWTEPSQLVQWRGSPGWHVETETRAARSRSSAAATITSRCATTIPAPGWRTDGVYTEYFDPDVFVSRERITGDPGIDPDVPLELRVEFTKTGRDGTLVRIIQGPYEPDVAGWHGEGWEKELTRLQDFLVSDGRQEAMS